MLPPNKFYKYTTLMTLSRNFRSSVDGWNDIDDGRKFRKYLAENPGRAIGMHSGEAAPMYETPLHALADGWRLMAPPMEDELHSGTENAVFTYTWWFEKEA